MTTPIQTKMRSAWVGVGEKESMTIDRIMDLEWYCEIKGEMQWRETNDTKGENEDVV